MQDGRTNGTYLHSQRVATELQNGTLCSVIGLLVKTRNFPELSIGIKVVLNPELSAGLLQERFHRRAGRGRLIRVELGGGNEIQLPLFRIVVQIAAQHDWAGFRQL